MTHPLNPNPTHRWLETDVLDSLNDIFHHGEIEVVGQVTWGSNFTFLVQVEGESGSLPAIYKPEKGERPLWDFPYGSLSDREVAAFRVSQALGWALVPPTIKRADGPAGPGSLQLYVEADAEVHYFTLSDAQKQRLKPTALFDILINNADRKSGHLLLDEDDHLWLIDHGLSFHQEYKLRTVVWDFVGEPIPSPLLASIAQLVQGLAPGEAVHGSLCTCLAEAEIKALLSRASGLLGDPFFPSPGPGRPYPWPLV